MFLELRGIVRSDKYTGEEISMKQAIIIFTRVPIPGETKTRMMPSLTPRECAQLHRCFLYDIEHECRKVDADIYICYTPQGKENFLVPILGRDKEYFAQSGAGLGERMHHGIEHVLNRGYEACLLIGTDVPEIRKEHLLNAFKVLNEKDVVFGPTEDGGYYLVGMNTPLPQVFERHSYGHADVLKNTTKILREKGITVGFVEELSDMDVPSDLSHYRNRMRRDKRLQKSQTGNYLMRLSRISIIVPIYNEESTIMKMQEQLRPLKNRCEILFVDGGSTDKTLDLLSSEFRVLHSQKGRQNQMNFGAKESTGDILFFLHCDSELPKRPLEQIRYVMKNHRVGCFGIAFHSRNFFMWTCRVISNHRVKDRKVIFGDQGLFIDRELFFQIGMFPDIPIMEDYQLSLTLKERKEKLGMTRKRIYTSDRRFPEGTIPKLKLMWKMNRLRKMYRSGVDINTISKAYKDIR